MSFIKTNVLSRRLSSDICSSIVSMCLKRAVNEATGKERKSNYCNNSAAILSEKLVPDKASRKTTENELAEDRVMGD